MGRGRPRKNKEEEVKEEVIPVEKKEEKETEPKTEIKSEPVEAKPEKNESGIKIKTSLTLSEKVTSNKGGGFIFHCKESGENMIVTNLEIDKNIAEPKLKDWISRMEKEYGA